MRSGSLPTSSLPFRVEGSPRGLGGFATAVLLILILAAAPLVLGAARLWYELPLLVALAALFLLQGLRLCGPAVAQARLHLDAIDLAVVVFVIYAVARWLTSPTEYFSRLEAMNVFAYAGIFLTARHGLARRTYGHWLLGLLVVLALGETAFGYYLVNHPDWFPFGDRERLQIYYAPRWVGTYGCPNHYAELLIMGAMAALALGSFSKLPWPVRIVLFYVTLVILMGVFYSISRGAWFSLLGALIALTVFALRHGTVRWWVPVVGALAIILLFAGTVATSPALQGRLAELRTSAVNFDGYVRYQLARDALHIAHDHPAFGTGPGTFVFVHPRYQDQAFTYKAELTHDDYLNCLTDYGLVGFALAIFFVFAVTLALWRRLGTEKRWRDRVLVAAGLGAWTSLCIHSLFDFNLHIPANAMILFALTGIALHSGDPEETPPRRWSTLSLSPLGRLTGVVIVLLSIAFGLEAARSAASDILYEQALAQAEKVPSIQSIEETQAALAWDHGNAQALALLGDIYRCARLPRVADGKPGPRGYPGHGGLSTSAGGQSAGRHGRGAAGPHLRRHAPLPRGLFLLSAGLGAAAFRRAVLALLGQPLLGTGHPGQGRGGLSHGRALSHGRRGQQ